MTECIDCGDVVTNPVCQQCTNKSVRQWLLEKNLPVYNLDSRLATFEEDSCIKCDGKLNICRYCHTKNILDWLKTTTNNKKVLAEFLEYFHFDLHKKGYLAKESF